MIRIEFRPVPVFSRRGRKEKERPQSCVNAPKASRPHMFAVKVEMCKLEKNEVRQAS